MAESDQQKDKGKDESIDYQGDQAKIDKQKAEAAQADRERLAEEHA